MAGDAVTGASVFQLVAALDAGDVFAEERYEVPAGATSATVLDDLAEIGAPLLAGVVDGITDGSAVATPQHGEPTLAPKLTLDDGALDLTRDADTLLHQIAGVTPEPGAHTTFDGARFKVLRAAPSDAPPLPPGRVAASGKDVVVGTGTTPLRLDTVQPAGKGAMNASDWFRGLRTDEPELGS
jgi:methionyl-tRNA formyltransferase